MRILFVVDYYYPHIGGMEAIFQQLAEGLVVRGHQVKVVTTCQTGLARFEELGGVEIERVPVPRNLERLFFIGLAVPLALRQANRFDLVHTATFSGAPGAFIAAKVFKKPCLMTLPEVLGNRWSMVETNPLLALGYRFVERMLLRLPFDRFVAISQATLQDALALGVMRDRASYLYSGVDQVPSLDRLDRNLLRTMIGADPDAFLYAYYGRPGITKGLDLLLDAAPLIQAAVPNAHLVLILAPQPYDQYLEMVSLADQQKKHARITILPPFPRKQRLFETLAGANCVVVPSRTEGFGLTTVEASSLSLPVIAARVGSIPEVISGKHILFEPASVNSLVEAVGRAARGDFDWIPPKSFSWADMITGYERIYQDLSMSSHGQSVSR
jgi:D-inositol-3-phosphate glycosyltransferase